MLGMSDFPGTNLDFADVSNITDTEKALRVMECRSCLCFPKLWIRDCIVLDVERFCEVRQRREYRLKCGCEFVTEWYFDLRTAREAWNRIIADS